MPAPAIIKGSDHFFVTTYEGNGGGQKVGNFVPFTDNGTIAKSCIFDLASNPKLNRTISSAGNRDTFTMSFWVKRCGGLGTLQVIFQHGADINNCTQFAFDTSNRIKYEHVDGGGTTDQMITNRTFEDMSKFYHIVLAVDTTQSTEANRVRIYVDGDEITSWNTANYPSQNVDTDVNSETGFYISSQISATQYPLDCYLAEVNFVDGTQYTPSTFGITDTSTGRWIPKSLTGISYGTNGFRFQFANSAGQTIGDDTSGQGNDFTVTNLAAADITTDSPTQNFPTHSPGFSGNIGLSQGGLKVTATASNDWETAYIGRSVKSGKWYFEYTATTTPTYHLIGLTTLSGYVNAKNTYVGDNAGSYGYQFAPGGNHYIYYDGSNTNLGSGSSLSNGNIVGVAYDADTGAFWVAVNNTWILSGNPSTGANPLLVAKNGAKQDIYFGISTYNGGVFDFNFGQKSLSYTPPTGFNTLSQDNYPTTDKGIPGFVWIKNRDASDAHAFYDSSRGPQKEWENSESNEATVTDGLQKFLKGGFAIEDNDALNTSAESYVAWNWVGNNGTEVANTDGSGATVATTVQANDTAGFSICRFQGTGSTLRFAHGLSATPEWFIVKRLDAGAGAATSVYHTYNGINKYLHLNEPDAMVSSGAATTQFTGVSSTYIQLGSNSNSNNSGSNVVAYVWRSVPGFSKIGSYTGNGNADGTFVFTDFSPSFVIIKCNSNASTDWVMYDNKRNPFNDTSTSSTTLYPNLTSADASAGGLHFLSNGFKFKSTNGYNNGSSRDYIFAAFAKHPFIGDGTNPATAR